MSQGYEGIDINFDVMSWGGLEYNGMQSLLDGSVNSAFWYYGVGRSSVWHGIPGPGTVEQAVELYVESAPASCGCPLLPAVEGMSISFTSPVFPTTARYACDTPGLVPSNGSAVRECQADGSWAGGAPTYCGCAPLPAPSGASVRYSNLQHVGSVANFSCESGTAQGSTDDRTCQADGSWTGSSWNGTWTLLFRQSAGNLRPPAQWVSYNPSANRSATEDFSILDTLEDYRQIDGFTLKLVWPLMSPENETGDNQQVWRQTNNPDGRLRTDQGGGCVEVRCGRAGQCPEDEYCASPNERHEVTCCSDIDLGNWTSCTVNSATRYAAREVGELECTSDATLAEAEATCAAVGARLCTSEELQASCGGYTGCNHDCKCKASLSLSLSLSLLSHARVRNGVFLSSSFSSSSLFFQNAKLNQKILLNLSMDSI